MKKLIFILMILPLFSLGQGNFFFNQHWNESIILCDGDANFDGGQSYPSINVVTLGTSTGNVTFNFDAYDVPDKFIVKFDGVEVINTGYRGNTNEQSSLDAALIALGEPTETIIPPGNGTATFAKTTATSTVIVEVYAPLVTGWVFSVSCPE